MKPKHFALCLFAVLLLTACAAPVAPSSTEAVVPDSFESSLPSVSSEQTSESLEYYGRFLVGEEDLDEFSALIRDNPIDYDYQYSRQQADDSNAGMNMGVVEYGTLWKTEMEAQYKKLYTLLDNYVQSGEISEARLTELSDAQTAFSESLKYDMTFVENTLGMWGDLSRMGTFGAVMINSRYASAYRQRTIDLMEYLYLIEYHVEFVYQSNYSL